MHDETIELYVVYTSPLMTLSDVARDAACTSLIQEQQAAPESPRSATVNACNTRRPAI